MAVVLDQRNEDSKKVIANEPERKTSSGVQRNKLLEGYKVILPINASGDYQEALDYAIETTKRYSGRLVLLYVTPETLIPDAFVQFAKNEGVRDLEWNYYNSLGEQKLLELGRYADASGIEWTSYVHIGKLKDALKAYSGNRKAIVILDPATNKKGSDSSNLTVEQISKIDVPVLVV